MYNGRKISVEEALESIDKSSIVKRRGGDKFKPEYIDVAARLIAAGFTRKGLGDVFDVNPSTITKWKKAFPQFKEACENGKRLQLKRMVAKAMINAAGYDYENVKRTITKNATGDIIKDEETIEKKHQAGNYNLMSFLLINLDRQLGETNWSFRKDLKVEDHRKIQVNIGTAESDRLADLCKGFLEGPMKKVESVEIENERKKEKESNA